jgi:hypothetical protein
LGRQWARRGPPKDLADRDRRTQAVGVSSKGVLYDDRRIACDDDAVVRILSDHLTP